MKTKKDLSGPVLLSALLFCAFLPGLQVQAETMYQISETELTELENNLATLESHNQERQKVLTEQATLLNQQKETIKKQASELSSLKKEIEISKAANEETKKSLESANAYLTELEKEARHKVQVKARQRNLWIAISGCVLYAYVRK